MRVVAENLTQYMTEYVVWRVLDHHRQGALYRAQQARKVWHEPPQRPGQRHRGRHHGPRQSRPCGRQGTVGARLSRQWLEPAAQPVAGVATFDGDNGLVPFLNATDILVVLLPLTPATRGIVTYALLRELSGATGSAAPC